MVLRSKRVRQRGQLTASQVWGELPQGPFFFIPGHAASREPSSLAHEALSEAGRAIDRIAEMLRREIEATSTQTTPDYSVATPPLPSTGATYEPRGIAPTRSQPGASLDHSRELRGGLPGSVC
jgi:hypothetical protein